MTIYLCWDLNLGETLEDSITVKAFSHAQAAENFVERCIYSDPADACDVYKVVVVGPENEPHKVFEVTVELTPVFHAVEIAKENKS